MPFEVDRRSYTPGLFVVRILPGVGSGSPQFSANQLTEILKTLQTKVPQKKIIIVDLRQEFHWLIRTEHDWMPIHLYGKNLSYNRTLIPEPLVNKEKALGQTLDHWPCLQALHIQDKELMKLITLDLCRNPKWPNFCLTEGQFIESQCSKNISYYRLPVMDRHFPSPEACQALIKLIESQPNHWLHFHCKAGRGRTTTFLMLSDMIKNKNKFTFDQYVQRQIDIGGVDFRKPKFSDRLRLLKQFHAKLLASPHHAHHE